MTHSTGQQFPNETYLNGLRDNPESTLAVLYDEFRMPVIQAVVARGGTEEAGGTAFQLAVMDAVRLQRRESLPDALPFSQFLQALSLAHYNAGLPEEEGAGSTFDLPESNVPETGTPVDLPGRDELLNTRNKLFAWEKLQELERECRQYLLREPENATPEEPDDHVETHAHCREAYAKRFSSETEPAGLPGWAESALQDRDGYAIWQRSQELEDEWKAGPQAPPESNRIWRWAVGILLIVAVGYGIYQFYFRPKTAAEVFADNFAPPASLMDDMKERYGPEMGNDSSGAQPSKCLMLLREADAYYQANEYDAAEEALLLLVIDENSICQSDALFFLGIVQLKKEEPAAAIQCFAKIEDLKRYGEDVYWYQALAFVQLAKENPMLRDKARRAVERTLGNTRDPKRRQQAETMLRNLSN